MVEKDGMGRRNVLQLSGGLLGSALVSSIAGAQEAETEFVTNELKEAGVGPAPTLEPLSRYITGAEFDEDGAEIPAFDPTTDRVFTVNSDESTVDVVDISNPESPTFVDSIDTADAFDDADAPTNVAIDDGVLAVAIEAETIEADGGVGFYNTETLTELAVVTVGPLPDMVTFSPDGETVLVANEGEPTDDYSVDPRGSVSIIDISRGFDILDSVGDAQEILVETAGFESFVGQEDQLRDEGVRIYGPDSDAAQDFEPEYIAVSSDSETAYVSLQENNAIGVIDVDAAEVTDVVSLGYKDFSLSGNELDAIDDGEINIRNEPLYGMHQPDTIKTHEIDGETYLIVANEGDAREYDGLFETGVLTSENGTYMLVDDDDGTDSIQIDDSAFDTDVLDALLGIEATMELGDTDNDGQLEELYLFGGRSFSILDEDGQQVFESGSQFERIAAETVPGNFNADNDENGVDEESEASGPEPEGVAVGEIMGTPYAFIGFEEVGGFAAYEVSDPTAPQFVQYLNTRDFSVAPEDDIEESLEDDDPTNDLPADAADDLGPEGLTFVSADESPTDDPLLIVCYEVSGTTTIYRIETSVVGLDSAAVGAGTTGTVDLSLLSAMDGFAGGRMTVSVGDTNVAQITDVSYADEFGLTRTPEISADGSAVELALSDIDRAVQPGATDVPLATIELEGAGAGTTDLAVEVAAFDDDAGNAIDVATRSGLAVTGPSQLPGAAGAPTDPDGDGTYEDVNGNGQADYDDIVLLFEHIDDDAVQLNADIFDFNDNGQVDFDDIIELAEMI